MPEEMSNLFCCSVSTSSLASLILSFMRSAVSLDLRAISVLAAAIKTFYKCIKHKKLQSEAFHKL